MVAIDARRRPDGSGWDVYNGGRLNTGLMSCRVRTVDRLGREILLTSMDCDGTKRVTIWS